MAAHGEELLYSLFGLIPYSISTSDFTLKPYYGTANLTFATAQETLRLDYITTTLYTDFDH